MNNIKLATLLRAMRKQCWLIECAREWHDAIMEAKERHVSRDEHDRLHQAFTSNFSRWFHAYDQFATLLELDKVAHHDLADRIYDIGIRQYNQKKEKTKQERLEKFKNSKVFVV